LLFRSSPSPFLRERVGVRVAIQKFSLALFKGEGWGEGL